MHRLILLIAACAGAVRANAATPDEIFRGAGASVVVLEVLDREQKVRSLHSATMVRSDAAVVQCDLLDGAGSLRIRRGADVHEVALGHQDVLRNLCLLNVPAAVAAPAPSIAATPPMVGARVYAVGNQLGLGVGISEGVVSALRSVRGETWIQHTAAVAPGAEGGALFDADGRLVGVTRYRRLDGQNVNFAAPAAWIGEIPARAALQTELHSWRAQAVLLTASAQWERLAAHAKRRTDAVPDEVEAWRWAALAFGERQQWGDAAKAYAEIVRQDPQDIPALLGRSLALLQSGDAAGAAAAAREGLAQYRENALLWIYLAYALDSLRQADAAGKAMEEAARLDPTSKAVHSLVAQLAARRGDSRAAIAARRQVVQIDPTDGRALLELADAYYQNGRYDLALATAERLLQVEPESGDARLFKGVSLSLMGAQKAAIDTLKDGLARRTLNPARGWFWLGSAYYTQQLFPEAIDAYREAVRGAPKNPIYSDWLGIALKDDGRFQEALALFEQAKAERPRDPLPWRQIGYVSAYLDRTDAAIGALEQSLRLDAAQPKVLAALVLLYQRAGRRKDAGLAYERLARLDAATAKVAYRDAILPYEDLR